MGEHRRVALGALALALALAPSCAREEPPPPPPAAARRAPEPARADRVEPGELAEGDERAFGFPIPRKLEVVARFPDAVYATGPVAPERVANYAKERLVAAHVETGPVKTVYDKATVKGGEPRPLRVEVARVGGTTRLLVRDLTRKKAEAGISDEERWRRLGLTPQGKLANPNTMQ